MSAVVKSARRAPSRRAQPSIAPAGATVRSEEPAAACSAGQRSAPAPVPRWSTSTIRRRRATGPSRARTRVAKGTPGCPGPPVSATSVPSGAVAAPWTATLSRSVPATRPERSSGTASVEHVKPLAPAHGAAPVRRGAGPSGAVAVRAVVAAWWPPPQPARTTRSGAPSRVRAPTARQSRMAGKSTTSRSECRPVRSMTSRSMPSPRPPVGGIPCSSASTKTSS